MKIKISIKFLMIEKIGFSKKSKYLIYSKIKIKIK
jgi:hypothetical protein